MNFLIQAFIYLVLYGVSTILASAETQQQKKTSGVRSSRQVGGDNSRAFVIGQTGIGGQFEYWADWGNDGETPNAYHSEVYSLGDVPYSGLAGMFYNGARGTLLYGEPHGSLGIPVAEARVGGKDHLWVKFYDGNQTTADAMLVANTAGQDKPWMADMVFRGCPYVIVTCLFNRELFTGIPSYIFEVQGIPLYDMTQDSSVGGVGAQRVDNPASWAYSDDPMVAASNVLLGIRYQGEWLCGGQTILPYQLPATIWLSQINKSKARGFRCGYEVVCGDDEPQAIIGEFLMAAATRIAEIGGIYKVLVAEPDAPVKSFTDEDIMITDDRDYDPFPGLEATTNAIAPTYPEPAEAYGMKEAPIRYNAALEAADEGRRLVKPIAYKAVPYAEQVQELAYLALEESRRLSTYIATMRPEWWEMEPLDVEEWTSAHNGYVAKRFLITAMDDLPTGNQIVGRREIDPADYDWSSGYLLPWDVAPLGISRPAPQAMTGWDVQPYVHLDNASQGRRPGILVLYAAALIDVRAVRVQVRRSGETLPFFDGEFPYDVVAVAPSNYIISDGLLPNQPYEARGIFVPFSGRATEWSGWLAVTTPNVKLGAADIDIVLADIARGLVEDLKWISQGVRSAQENFASLGSLLSAQDLANFNDREAVKRELRKEVGDLQASFTQIIEVTLGPGGAIAQSLESIFAAMGGNTAEAAVRWSTEATPVGVSARWGLRLYTDGETTGLAAILAQVDENGASQIILDADRTVMSTDGGQTVSAVFNSDGALIRDLTVGTIRSADGKSLWDLTTGLFRIST